MPDWLVDIGVSALLRIVQDTKERKRWARALAKVFDAIQRAAATDSLLAAAIKEKQA